VAPAPSSPGPSVAAATDAAAAADEPAAEPDATPAAVSTTPSTPGTTVASRTPKPKPKKTSKPAKTPKPTKTASSVPTAAHIVVTGKVATTTYFTLKQLKKMRVFSGDYFSKGKEPEPTATNSFVGVRLTDILKAAGVKESASKVTILAADDYSASFTMRQVRAEYIDETRPGVTLPMIIAWSEDGTAYTGDHPFRLVMGQAVEGDYNRQYWVRLVISVTVD
jgi:DMSO/TMAO reductase YedYZ molybdopterin-dependent catalytic subunit